MKLMRRRRIRSAPRGLLHLFLSVSLLSFFHHSSFPPRFILSLSLSLSLPLSLSVSLIILLIFVYAIEDDHTVDIHFPGHMEE